jgi:hypothetical protein
VAGYSGKALVQKLGIKPGFRIFVIPREQRGK